MSRTVGTFEFDVSAKGWPMQASIRKEGQAYDHALHLNQRDLCDLEHVVQQIKREFLLAMKPEDRVEIL